MKCRMGKEVSCGQTGCRGYCIACSRYCFVEEMSRKEKQKGKVGSFAMIYLSECCFVCLTHVQWDI